MAKGAVSIVVRGPENKILLGKRRDSGKWCCPGGSIEIGEHQLDGAVRELFEETGLTPISIEHHGTHNGGPIGQLPVHVFHAEVEPDSTPVLNHDPDNEFVEFRWMDPMLPLPVEMRLHHQPDHALKWFTGMVGPNLEFAKSQKPNDFNKIGLMHEPLGEDLADSGFKFGIPETVEAGVKDYRDNIVNSNKKVPAVRRSQGLEVSPKKVYESPKTHERYMVKPYHETITDNVDYLHNFPFAGWSELTNQALYHAGGIGHLHQKVHADTVKLSNGETIPVTVTHLDRQANRPVAEISQEDFKDPQHLSKIFNDVAKIGLMDFLSNNNDRHSNNLMMEYRNGSPARLLAIDHGRSFNYKIAHQTNADYGFNFGLERDYPVWYLRDSNAMAMLGRFSPAGTHPYSIESLQNALEWWGQNEAAIVKAFEHSLGAIKNPATKKFLEQNFKARVDTLNRLHDRVLNDQDLDLGKYSPRGQGRDLFARMFMTRGLPRPRIMTDPNIHDVATGRIDPGARNWDDEGDE